MRQFVNFISAKKVQVFLLIAVLYILVMFHRTSTSAIIKPLSADINLDPFMYGFMSSSYFVCYAIVQPFIGFLTDKFGAKKVIFASFILTSFACILFGYVDSFSDAVIARAVLGFSTSGIFIPALKLFGDWFLPGQFTKVSGLFIGLGNAGALAATLPLAYLEAMIGWRGVFSLLFWAGLFLSFAVLLIVKNSPLQSPQKCNKNVTTQPNQKKYFQTVKSFVFSKNFLSLELIFFCVMGIYYAFLGTWATKFFTTVNHISDIIANGIIIFLPLGYLFGSTLAGYISNKIFSSKILSLKASLITQLICWSYLTIFTMYTHHLMLAVILLITGFSIGMVPPLIFSQVKETIPQEVVGLSIGLTNPAIFFGAFFFQLITGFILDTFNVSETYSTNSFSIMMTFCVVAIFTALLTSFTLSDPAYKPLRLQPIVVKLRERAKPEIKLLFNVK